MADRERPDNDRPVEAVEYAPGLRRIRRRRWVLWSIILIYVPVMWFTLGLSSAFSTLGSVFAGWFILLFAAAMVTALARCPRCGNYFHVHGLTFLCLRRCLHCQLHLKADRRD